MKLLQIFAAGGLALAVIAGPAAAQHVERSRTTVSRVHGPLKILPHHNRKICKTRMTNHRRVRKCYYR